MRRAFAIVAAGLSAPLLGGQGPALPPAGKKEPAPLVLPPTTLSPLESVRKEREALTKDRDVLPAAAEDEDTAERRLLRKRLEDLLTRLNTKPAPAPKKADPADPRATEPPPKPMPPAPVTDVAKAVDAVAQATALYRNGDVQAALGVFKLVEPTSLTREDRAYVLYMIAGCHRRLNDLDKANQIYRDIIEANLDPFYVECATWQLASVRWRQDLDKQLSDLRQRREAVPPK